MIYFFSFLILGIKKKKIIDIKIQRVIQNADIPEGVSIWVCHKLESIRKIIKNGSNPINKKGNNNTNPMMLSKVESLWVLVLDAKFPIEFGRYNL